jgi:hypothetical protein
VVEVVDQELKTVYLVDQVVAVVLVQAHLQVHLQLNQHNQAIQEHTDLVIMVVHQELHQIGVLVLEVVLVLLVVVLDHIKVVKVAQEKLIQSLMVQHQFIMLVVAEVQPTTAQVQ